MVIEAPLTLYIGAYRQVLIDVITEFTIIQISAANPAVILTAEDHGMNNGDLVVITSSNSTPAVDGIWTVTVLGPRSFSVPVNVLVGGNQAKSAGTPTNMAGWGLTLIGRRRGALLFEKTLAGGGIALANGLATNDRAVGTLLIADTFNLTAGPGDWALWRTDIPTTDPLTFGPLTMIGVAMP